MIAIAEARFTPENYFFIKLANMPKILLNPNQILRKKARLIHLEEIGSIPFKELVADMAAELSAAENGIGLAAPQIGISKAIFIILEEIANLKTGALPENTGKEEANKKEVLVFVNPRIVKNSRKTEMMNEGCLSVPGIYGNIKRFRQVTIEALDENGNKMRRGAGGLLAQVFQHECDHLRGVLFIDNATNLQKNKK